MIEQASFSVRKSSNKSKSPEYIHFYIRWPHGGIGGVLVIGYWLLPVPTVRFERRVPPVRFHPVPVLGSWLGS